MKSSIPTKPSTFVYFVATAICTLALLCNFGSQRAWCDASDGSTTDPNVSPLSTPGQPLLGWSLATQTDDSVATLTINPDQHDDHQGLLLKGDFSKATTDYLEIGYTVSNVVDPSSVTMYLNASNVTYLRLRIEDSSEQWHQMKVSIPAGSGWRKWTFSFTDFFAGKRDTSFDPEYNSWNGANDQKWHGPMKAFDIVIDPPQTDDKRFSLGISEPALNVRATP